ncbi:MAG: hypothetical protein K0S37_755 [Microbacterium sp.]|jgi:hypothetical protein|nr:hypothetical protein [Microbacterium sp.]
MTRLLALDPGGTTGFSVWEYGPLQPLTHIHHGQIAGGLRGFGAWARRFDEPIDEVVAESFVDDHRTADPDVTPLRIEGVIDFVWGVHGVPVVLQRNFAKAHARDALLERMGWWWKGQEHARDSARHAVAFLKTARHAPTLRLINPPRPRTERPVLAA